MKSCPHCGEALATPNLVHNVQSEVAHYYGLSMAALMSDRRDKHLSGPRQIAMYLSRQMTMQSLPAIARRFNRDHTTVMWAIKAVQGRIAADGAYARDVAVLRARLAA